MEHLGEIFDRIDHRSKRLEIHTGDSAVAAGIESQFSTLNLEVSRELAPPWYPAEFLVVRDASGAFEGAIGIGSIQATGDPGRSSLGEVFDREATGSSLFDFFDEAVFVTDDRSEILAATREIEDRARRVGRGNLYVSFQRSEAFQKQRTQYEQFARETDVTAHVFVEDHWRGDRPEGMVIVDEAPGEIGDYWIVLFDGGDQPIDACGLNAREDETGYSGFWTYDRTLVEELIAYLESEYLS